MMDGFDAGRGAPSLPLPADEVVRLAQFLAACLAPRLVTNTTLLQASDQSFQAGADWALCHYAQQREPGTLLALVTVREKLRGALDDPDPERDLRAVMMDCLRDLDWTTRARIDRLQAAREKRETKLAGG